MAFKIQSVAAITKNNVIIFNDGRKHYAEGVRYLLKRIDMTNCISDMDYDIGYVFCLFALVIPFSNIVLERYPFAVFCTLCNKVTEANYHLNKSRFSQWMLQIADIKYICRQNFRNSGNVMVNFYFVEVSNHIFTHITLQISRRD